MSLVTSHNNINADKLQFPNQGFQNYGFFFFQQIMIYFLANCVPKISNYAQIAQYFKAKIFNAFNVLSLQNLIFFGYTFSTKLSIFKAKHQKERFAAK